MMAKLLTALLLAWTTAAVAQEPRVVIEWSDGPKLPQPLGGHSAAVLDEGIVVAGGSNWPDGKKVWRDEIYVLRDGAWKRRAKLPAGLTLSAAAVSGGKLLLLGGWYESGTTGDTYAYANGRAERIALDLPGARAQAGGGVLGETIYVVGGMSDAADFKSAFNSAIKFERGAWKDAAPLPRPLALSSIIGRNGELYLFGGMGPVNGKPGDSADAFRYEPQANVWTKIASLPQARRGAGVAALDDRYLLIVGGCHNDDKDEPVMSSEVLAYDARENRYLPCSPLPYAALCIATVVNDGRIYAIGGEDLPRHRTDRVVVGRISARP